MEKKKIHIVSLGCPKNLIDSEVMAAILFKDGFQITPRPEEADIILINTCAFVLPAKEESIDEIFRMARMKKEGKCRYLIISGCLPQRYGAILEKEIPEVDLFLGTGEIPNIAGLIRKLDGKGSETHRSFIGQPDFLMNASHPRLISTPFYSAYLKIAEGCSNHCSYCVIPLVRGRFRSREVGDILKETEILANAGVKEIILTAQETTAYGRDLKRKSTLATLMKGLASIDGIRWIRLLYTYPVNITSEILETIVEEKKICKYIDIPVQHIDDDILKSMNRKGNSQSIKDIIRKAREIIPGVALRTSLIVGFPGETPEKFNSLLEFVKETRFDHLGVFKYSQEEETKAAELPFQVSEEEKEGRRNIIMEEQSIISYEINQSLTGSVHEIIIEEKSDIPGYTHVGRLQRQSPDIDGVTYVNAREKTPGDIINCRITSADEYDLYAEEVGS
ncbi:MAG: 30S ribosomal protein S12 methylthiotransferase RimO [Syntrophobacterales bacterium]|nr:30S ribosomal protein S12 methylthiotransferase RimO [Syntrophobacterales bacterium]